MKRSELVYEKTNGLAPFSYTVVDKWLYFCDQYIPGLFRYHFEKELCECVAKIIAGYNGIVSILSYSFSALGHIPFLYPILR